MKSFIKLLVLLMFAFVIVSGCSKAAPEEEDEKEEEDDLTLLDNVARLFTDAEIAELTVNADPATYIFQNGDYKCQFLTSTNIQGVEIIDSCIFKDIVVPNTYSGSISYTGTHSKISHHTVVIASDKSAKKKYDPDCFTTLLWTSSGMDWDGWKGLIGSYTDNNPHNLYGKTVGSLFAPDGLILEDATTIQTNSSNDKIYVHKTVDGKDIQICLIYSVNQF